MGNPRVAIVDYGMSNLKSVVHMFGRLSVQSRVVTRPSELDFATHIVIPGVGSFAQAMTNLTANGWPERIVAKKNEPNVSVLGICLGMQLLASWGTEGGDVRGLDLIPGKVMRMSVKEKQRLPHMGWNQVEVSPMHPGGKAIFKEIPESSDFYFVHSYRFVPAQSEDVLGMTSYGEGFVSCVMRERVLGLQFHPEKSSRNGAQLIKNFLDL